MNISEASIQNWFSVTGLSAKAATSGSSGSGSSSNASNAAGTGASSLANQNVFLQLLVTQLKHQDPQSPADGTQFVTQLAQFTTLDKTTQATADLDQILKLLQASTPSKA